MPIIYWNLVLWGHFVCISTHLDNFSINRILNWKKVSFSKPPPTPFRQSPPKQQGSWNHTFLRGKDKQTNVVLKRLPERRQRKTETRQSTVLLHSNAFWQILANCKLTEFLPCFEKIFSSYQQDIRKCHLSKHDFDFWTRHRGNPHKNSAFIEASLPYQILGIYANQNLIGL